MAISKQRSIRILVANHPKLMREAVVAAFASQPDIEIVGEVSDNAQIEDRVNQTTPDLLITTLDESGERPGICDAVLNMHPRMGIIGVSSSKNYIVCYKAILHIKSKSIESSEKSMLVAARNMVAGTLDFSEGTRTLHDKEGQS